jgi:hypothetical protein
MKMKNTVTLTLWQLWLRVIGAVLILIVGWGVLSPMLMNQSASDFGVGLAYVITLLTPAFFIWILVPVAKFVISKFKNQ